MVDHFALVLAVLLLRHGLAALGDIRLLMQIRTLVGGICIGIPVIFICGDFPLAILHVRGRRGVRR